MQMPLFADVVPLCAKPINSHLTAKAERELFCSGMNILRTTEYRRNGVDWFDVVFVKSILFNQKFCW